jgi:hypothetical protein
MSKLQIYKLATTAQLPSSIQPTTTNCSVQALGNMLRFFAKSVEQTEEPENAAIQTQPSMIPAVDWRGVSDIWYIVGKNVSLIQSKFLAE